MKTVITLISIIALVSCGEVEKASQAVGEAADKVKGVTETSTVTSTSTTEEVHTIDENKSDSDFGRKETAQNKDEWVDPVTGNLWFLGAERSVEEVSKVKKLCPGKSVSPTGDELEDARDAGLLEHFQADEEYSVWIFLAQVPEYQNYGKFDQSGYTLNLGKDEALLGTIQLQDISKIDKPDEVYFRTMCMVPAE